MIRVFLTWWAQQLLSLWPDRAAARRGDAVLLALRPDAVAVTLRRGRRTGTLGVFPLTENGMAALSTALGGRRGPAELRLPPGMMLDHRVTLPLAAERELDGVLRYEMNRLTPFSADELHWTYAVERRDRARSQLHVRLWMVLRQQVSGALDMLGRAGLRPAALGAQADGAETLIRLDAVRPGPWRRRGTAVLVALCAGLAVAAVVVPFWQQSRASDRIERQIAQYRPAVDRAEAVRRSMAAAAAGVDVVAAQRAKVGDPLAILATLTDILPDDTVLTDFSLRQRVITMSGQSATAARLIPALAAEPVLRDPAFTAPVTRNETMHIDGFSIRATAASPAEAVAAVTRR